MKSLFISGLLVTLMVWLSACSQTPPAPAPDYLLPGASHSGHSPLQIRVSLASYLDQGGIVLQLSDTELHVARQHRWAEPLGSQLQRAPWQARQPSLNWGNWICNSAAFRACRAMRVTWP